MNIYFEKININHTQMEFDCGNDEINSFFERSLDEVLRNNSKVYVLRTKTEIIGLFALAMSSIRAEIDRNDIKHPVCLLCQLGVNLKFQNIGYGSFLIDRAKKLAQRTATVIGCKGMVVETYREELIDTFYAKNNFEVLDKKIIKGKKKYILFCKFEVEFE